MATMPPHVQPSDPHGTPLRVFRIEPGVEVHVRVISRAYGGLYTHYARGRSRYCAGGDCEAALHRTERFWKGYAAALLWEEKQRLWWPVCLEMTEHLELDFRGRYKPGQVWRLWRLAQSGRKRTPAEGELVEDPPPGELPTPFDYTPCLKHLYHVEHIDLSARNPLPERVLVNPQQGLAPPGCGDRRPVVQPASQEEFRKLRAAADPDYARRLKNGDGPHS